MSLAGNPIRGRVVILNGPSSSGKTSLARALQTIWDGPLLLIGLDAMIAMLPFSYTGSGSRAADGYQLIPGEENGAPTTRYVIGEHGRRLNKHLANLAVRLVADGFDVVVDHVIIDDETMRHLALTCPADRTYVFGVTCDLDVLARREAARGDRMLGLARHQSPATHDGWRPYDLMLDSTEATPDQLAAKVRDKILSRTSRPSWNVS